MIFKANNQVDTLPVAWVLCPLGPRGFVEQVVYAAIQMGQGETSTLTIDVEK
jgi:hypothetical protein